MADGVDATLLVQAVELEPDGVLIVDRAGTIVYANRSMCTLAGSDDLVGTVVDTLVPEGVRRHHTDLRRRYAEHPTQRPMGAGLDLSLEVVKRLDLDAAAEFAQTSPR